MFSTYEIKKINDDEVLFLYFKCHYEEFGSEFLEKGKDVVLEVKRLLGLLGDSFKGKKVILVVNGILITSLICSGSNVKLDTITVDKKVYVPTISEVLVNTMVESGQIKEIEVNDVVKKEVVNKEKSVVKEKSNNSVSNSINKNNNSSNNNAGSGTTEKEVVDTKTYVTVHRSSGVVERIELEEYVIGVVGAEMPASFGVEALKAQSLLARTYALKAMKDGRVLTDTVKTQVYNDVDQLKSKWGSSFNIYYNKIKSAVMSTAGQYITYNGNYIDAVYHSTSNGKTEDSVYVWGNSIPYLKSVDSHWDLKATSYYREMEKSISQINSLLGLQLDELSEFSVLEQSTSGRVNKVLFGDKVFDGKSLYEILGLRSRDFELIINKDKVIVITRGYGHGVGMSQYGAAGMALEGYTYRQIISHYYQGVKIVNNQV